jgi:hypothetical protein
VEKYLFKLSIKERVGEERSSQVIDKGRISMEKCPSRLLTKVCFGEKIRSCTDTSARKHDLASKRRRRKVFWAPKCQRREKILMRQKLVLDITGEF